MYAPFSDEFSTVLNPDDYLSILESRDQLTVVLRSHLITEEFLNLWCKKTTSCDALFDRCFVPYKTKNQIARNLGLPDQAFSALDYLNDLRNKFSHNHRYVITDGQTEKLRSLVDLFATELKLVNCNEFSIHTHERHESGMLLEVSYSWENSPAEKKVFIVLCVLTMKLTKWIQDAFKSRGVNYQLVD